MVTVTVTLHLILMKSTLVRKQWRINDGALSMMRTGMVEEGMVEVVVEVGAEVGVEVGVEMEAGVEAAAVVVVDRDALIFESTEKLLMILNS
jgi:hypothetical protein